MGQKEANLVTQNNPQSLLWAAVCRNYFLCTKSQKKVQKYLFIWDFNVWHSCLFAVCHLLAVRHKNEWNRISDLVVNGPFKAPIGNVSLDLPVL